MGCNHIWNRTNAVTTEDGYDLFRCEKCGARGKAAFAGPVFEVRDDLPQKRGRIRDYAKEYKQRKFWRDFEKRIERHRSGELLGLEWSLTQAIRRLESADKLSDDNAEMLATMRSYLEELNRDE